MKPILYAIYFLLLAQLMHTLDAPITMVLCLVAGVFLSGWGIPPMKDWMEGPND